MDDVLNTPAYREIVVRLLTLEVVSVCRDLSMPRNNRAIQDIGFAISCWSVDTHTFVGAWGESGPMLEDAFVLMRSTHEAIGFSIPGLFLLKRGMICEGSS